MCVPAEQLLNLLGDCVKVMAAEVLVDWVKHAFVTRFNAISWQVSAVQI